MSKNPELSIILPCQNEELALPHCLKTICSIIKKHKLNAEIIVSDSSTDKSPQIAKKFGARLVKHDLDGYGNAYLEGINAARGKYIFMADADNTYDFTQIPAFLTYLKEGNQFVIGNRFAYKLEKESMPFLHKYVGNPILSGMFNIFFHTKIKDVHCGMRAIRKVDFDALNLHTTGMEFASEMIVEISRRKYSIKQVPTKYAPRIGESKLQTWRDGWRHVRFMLLYSPTWLFILPGILLSGISSILFVLNYTGSLSAFGSTLQYHPLFLWSAGLIIGFQMILFGLFAKTFTYTLHDGNAPFMDKFFKMFTLEKGIFLGLFLIIVAAVVVAPDILNWILAGQPSLDKVKEFILALNIGIIGVQLVFGSFMISALGVKVR